MKTLVIHPEDPSTEFLKIIYRNLDCTILNDKSSSAKIRNGLKEHQRIFLLGHGIETGLLSPYGGEQFGRLIVGPREVNFLRGKEVISVFCNSNIYGIKYGLSGLFSGMIISEESEAFDLLGHFVEEGKLNIVGVGLSCTGIVNIKKQKIVQCHNLPYLDDTTLEGLIFPDIQEKFKRNGIDICLLQNSNAAVLAEKVFLYRNDSDYKYRKNVVAIYMGVGIGAGFLLDNSLFVGTTGFSGEIGHISAPELPKEYEEICKELHKKYTNRSIDKGCTCGKTDCYDFAIRTKVFLSSTKEMAEETSKSIESYLRENDGAQKILGFYLGNMVNMLTSMLNVDLIVFTGKIAQSMPLLFNHIAKIQDKNLLKFSRNDCAIIKSEYGALSPAIGSAIFSYYHKYSIDCEWN